MLAILQGMHIVFIYQVFQKVLDESKTITRLAGYRINSMWSVYNTKMKIYLPKANLDRSKKNADKEHVWERGFHIPFWSMIYFLLKSKFYS